MKPYIQTHQIIWFLQKINIYMGAMGPQTSLNFQLLFWSMITGGKMRIEVTFFESPNKSLRAQGAGTKYIITKLRLLSLGGVDVFISLWPIETPQQPSTSLNPLLWTGISQHLDAPENCCYIASDNIWGWTKFRGPSPPEKVSPHQDGRHCLNDHTCFMYTEKTK